MSDTSNNLGFGKFVPGFDFLQSLAKGASSSIPQLPNLSNWVAPTISVEELEKRVEELKAVQFWLDQNAVALKATIQALEVQKMTLSTLKGMNVSMGDMASLFQPKAGSEAKAPAASLPNPADAFAGVTQAMTDAMARATSAFAAPMAQAAKAGEKAAAPAPAPAAAPAPEAAQGQPASAATGGVVDPMQWWGALTQQFQQIAASAMQDVSQQASLEKAAGMTQDAFKAATDMAGQMAATGMGGMKAKPAQGSPDGQAPADAAHTGAQGPAPEDGYIPPAGKKAAPRRAAATPSKRARGD